MITSALPLSECPRVLSGPESGPPVLSPPAVITPAIRSFVPGGNSRNVSRAPATVSTVSCVPTPSGPSSTVFQGIASSMARPGWSCENVAAARNNAPTCWSSTCVPPRWRIRCGLVLPSQVAPNRSGAKSSVK